MQSRHRYRALQAVEPKWEVSVVLAEPHCGQCTTSALAERAANCTTLALPDGALAQACGGAMPYARSLLRPSSLIQSVVHAGDSTVRTAAATTSRSCPSTASRSDASKDRIRPRNRVPVNYRSCATRSNSHCNRRTGRDCKSCGLSYTACATARTVTTTPTTTGHHKVFDGRRRSG